MRWELGIDLLVTDMVMPGWAAASLAECGP